jgi:hypothetical protein
VPDKKPPPTASAEQVPSGSSLDVFGERWTRAAEFSPSHPWECHPRRIPDGVVFEHVSSESVARSI